MDQRKTEFDLDYDEFRRQIQELHVSYHNLLLKKKYKIHIETEYLKSNLITLFNILFNNIYTI